MTRRFLEPDILNDRKADAMRLKQPLGEIEFAKSKAHESAVSGIETTFLSLPREIRDEIYTLALAPGVTIDFEHDKTPKSPGHLFPFKISAVRENTGAELNLLRVSKQIRSEADEIFYKYNTFLFETGYRLAYTPRKVEDMQSLRNFHRSLTPPAFDMIRELEFNLSTDDGPCLGESSCSVFQMGSTKLDYLKDVDPQYREKYARICATSDGIVLDKHVWLFASWVNKLDHVFRMPALRRLSIDLNNCEWSDHRCGFLREWERTRLATEPRFSSRVVAVPALMSRMRDRKKSDLGNVEVTVRSTTNEFSLQVVAEQPGVWEKNEDVLGSILVTNTADFDLEYSADNEWSASRLTESDGFWWIGKPFPVRTRGCSDTKVHDYPYQMEGNEG